jgi:hypothetical protein
MLANEVETFPSTAYIITQNVEHVAENATAPSVFGTSQNIDMIYMRPLNSR